MKEAGVDASVQAGLLKETSDLLAATKSALDALSAVTDKAAAMDEGEAQARF